VADEYTPTTEEIRDYVEVGGEPQPWMPPDDDKDAARAAAFDRWLAAHDAEIRRDQAETIIEWIEGKNLGGVYPDFQNETEYHAALRAQFTPSPETEQENAR